MTYNKILGHPSGLIIPFPKRHQPSVGADLSCPSPIYRPVLPVPLSDIAVVFDSLVVTMGTVYCGSGRNDRTLEIKLRDLLRISGEQVHSFAREQG